MGNSHRSGTPGIQLYLQLEYPFYVSGQIMRGVVFLSTAENLVGCALYLTVEGTLKAMQESRSASGTKGVRSTVADTSGSTTSTSRSSC